MEPREGSLRQRVLQLVMHFRMDLVEQRLKSIQREVLLAKDDIQRTMQLLEEFKSTQELRNLLARKLGCDVIAG